MPWKPPPRLPEFRTADLSDDPHARTPEETEAMLRRVVGDEKARAAIRGKEWESRRDERKRKEEERKADERWMRDYASREGERQKRWEASKARARALKVAYERREKKRRRELEKRIRHMPPRLREIGMQVLRDGGWYRNGHLDPPEARMPEIPRTQYGRVQPKMNPEVRNYNNLVEAAGDFDFRYPNFDA